ncbi:hypothetical protein [Microbispora sp. KK1-11]|uniref:hypothetical protein n=1 Tax=Microbispora sp. KK1-11 TaxID=2053005 RepID=UPI00163C0D14|nr:hypothetical protein [Microbispora sp. KK1-11]
MTVPEENAPKTDQNDQALSRQAAPAREGDSRHEPQDTEMAAKLKEAMSEADVDRDDFA